MNLNLTSEKESLAPVVVERELDRDGVTGMQANLMELLYTLECSVSAAHISEVKEGNHNYIPFSHLTFFSAIKDVLDDKDLSKMKFLEIGCGLGTKLHIASKWLGFQRCDGVEINENYVKIAKNMTKGNVYCADVRNFNQYYKYDVIYTYGELTDAKESFMQDRRVATMMKEGAFLFMSFAYDQVHVYKKTANGLLLLGYYNEKDGKFIKRKLIR